MIFSFSIIVIVCLDFILCNLAHSKSICYKKEYNRYLNILLNFCVKFDFNLLQHLLLSFCYICRRSVILQGYSCSNCFLDIYSHYQTFEKVILNNFITKTLYVIYEKNIMFKTWINIPSKLRWGKFLVKSKLVVLTRCSQDHHKHLRWRTFYCCKSPRLKSLRGFWLRIAQIQWTTDISHQIFFSRSLSTIDNWDILPSRQILVTSQQYLLERVIRTWNLY